MSIGDTFHGKDITGYIEIFKCSVFRFFNYLFFMFMTYKECFMQVKCGRDHMHLSQESFS